MLTFVVAFLRQSNFQVALVSSRSQKYPFFFYFTLISILVIFHADIFFLIIIFYVRLLNACPPNQTIGAEIAAHEQTVEDMRRRNVANLPPSTADGKAAKGGTMLDQLQVTLTPAGEIQVLRRANVNA